MTALGHISIPIWRDKKTGLLVWKDDYNSCAIIWCSGKNYKYVQKYFWNFWQSYIIAKFMALNCVQWSQSKLLSMLCTSAQLKQKTITKEWLFRMKAKISLLLWIWAALAWASQDETRCAEGDICCFDAVRFFSVPRTVVLVSAVTTRRTCCVLACTSLLNIVSYDSDLRHRRTLHYG